MFRRADVTKLAIHLVPFSPGGRPPAPSSGQSIDEGRSDRTIRGNRFSPRESSRVGRCGSTASWRKYRETRLPHGPTAVGVHQLPILVTSSHLRGISGRTMRPYARCPWRSMDAEWNAGFVVPKRLALQELGGARRVRSVPHSKWNDGTPGLIHRPHVQETLLAKRVKTSLISTSRCLKQVDTFRNAPSAVGREVVRASPDLLDRHLSKSRFSIQIVAKSKHGLSSAGPVVHERQLRCGRPVAKRRRPVLP